MKFLYSCFLLQRWSYPSSHCILSTWRKGWQQSNSWGQGSRGHRNLPHKVRGLDRHPTAHWDRAMAVVQGFRNQEERRWKGGGEASDPARRRKDGRWSSVLQKSRRREQNCQSHQVMDNMFPYVYTFYVTINLYTDYKLRHYLYDIPYHTYHWTQYKKIIAIRNTSPTIQLYLIVLL